MSRHDPAKENQFIKRELLIAVLVFQWLTLKQWLQLSHNNTTGLWYKVVRVLYTKWSSRQRINTIS